jgi:WD40 repeat protein
MVLDAALRGSKLLVAVQSGRVEVFDWVAGKSLEPLLTLPSQPGHRYPPTIASVAVSPGGRMVAVAASDGKLRILNLAEEKFPAPFRTFAASGVQVCRFLDERRLLLGKMTGELALLALNDGRELYRRQLEYDPVYALAVGPGGSRVAAAFRSSRIQILDAESGEMVEALEGHRDSVYDLGWLGENALVSGGKDKRIFLWDLEASPPRPQLLHRGDRPVTAVAVDPAGDRVAAAIEGEKIALIDLRSRRVSRLLAGHTAPVQVLAFAEGGRRLISSGNDARVLVWELVGRPEGEGP